MFDERHLQLTSTYAHSSELFVRDVILPLAKYIDEYIKKKVEASINKKLYWEVGKDTYAMSPDGKGGWKWEKYDPKSNEYISTTATETESAASIVADSITKGITGDAKQYELVDPQIIAETKQANLLSSTQGLKVETDDQSVVVHQVTNGTFGFSMIDKNNQIIRDSSFFQEFQSDLNQYLGECLDTFKNHPDIIKNHAECLKEILASSLSPQDSPKQTSTIEQVNEEVNTEVNPDFEEKVQGDIKEVVAEDSNIPPSQQESQSQAIPPAPEHIDSKHWQELVGGSAVAPGIASINFETLHFNQRLGKHEAWDFLMTGDKISRTNPGRVSEGILNTYSYLDNTDGWWCNAGVDPRQFEKMSIGETAPLKEWGCYKPDSPRPKTEKKDGVTVVVPGKFTKYEHPLGTERSIFLLDVPKDIAQGIYEKAGVDPSESDRASGFWYCVWKHNVPITITEGAKKTASLLSQGHAAIGLAGINGGYYKTKEQENPVDNEINTDLSENDEILTDIEDFDEIEAVDEEEDIEFDNNQGKPTHFLHPELAVFATVNREFKICFDFETAPKTVRNVDAATRRTGQLLEANGGKVRVISLPGPDKGVDDFIVAQGSVAFEQLLQGALPLPQWEEQLYLVSRQRDEKLYLDQDLRSTIKLKNGTTKVVQHRPRKVVKTPPKTEANDVGVPTPPAAVGSQPSPLENTSTTADTPNQLQRSLDNGTATVSEQQSSSPRQTDANTPKNAPTENESSSDNATVQTPPEQSTPEKEATQTVPKETQVDNIAVTANNEPALATELNTNPTPPNAQPLTNTVSNSTPASVGKQPSPQETTTTTTVSTPNQSQRSQHNGTATTVSGQQSSSPKQADANTPKTAIATELKITPTNLKIETPPSPTPNWTKTQDVTLYQRNWRRRQLEAKENQAIATAAVALVKKYGMKTDKSGKEVTYDADAFTIHKKGENYTISRRHDGKELMTFTANRWGEVRCVNLGRDFTNNKYPINILPIERQEFLLVADVMAAGKELPSVDDDPRQIASTLSSLSPKGTHNILESFKESEVLQILTQTITSFEKDDITLDNYRILFQQGSQGKSTLQLLKTEHNGSTREAVRFEFERTLTGMTHQVQAMAITEADLKKLRLLAAKLHINYQGLFDNPTDTRDLDLPLHPEIARNLDSEQSPSNYRESDSQRHVSHSTTPTPLTTTPSQRTKRQNNSSNLDKVLLSLHPVLKQYWQQLELDSSWNEVAKQNQAEFQSKIQQTGKLTVGEQRELYQMIQNQAWSQINKNGHTDIVLPPLAHIVNDLRSLSLVQPQPLLSSHDKPDTPIPLHPDIAAHWENLETNNTWSSVANQYNNPLREKLSKTGKLTIGEQRELYQKILLQSQVEQHSKGKTDISLPPLSDIVQDLMNTRNQIINDTYTPKIELNSQKSHTQQPNNPRELEF